MSIDLPIPNAIVSFLEGYQPERYWAVWQIPESRYAYMIGEFEEGWLIVMETERAGIAYLLQDAGINGRDATEYRLDALTMSDAFDAVRSQTVPFVSSLGTRVGRLMGLLMIAEDGIGRQIPL